MSKQKEVFLAGEGDRYFERNAGRSNAARPQFETFKHFLRPGARVLEIGCADGPKEPLFRALQANYFGIDPSQKAISEAKKKYPQSHFSVGTSDTLDFEDESFDFVFFGFCLYLVDRKLLMKTITEADRVLKNRAYLSIYDFETKSPVKRKYHHAENVFSHKMDYSSLFLAFPQYALCYKAVFAMEEHSHSFEENEQNRTSVSILYKNMDQGYSEA